MPHTGPPDRQTYKRILAVKLADLGDLLAVTPALQALRAAHPSSRIDLLTPPSSAGLLRGAPFVDEIVSFDKFAFDTPAGLLNLKGILRTTRFLISLRRRRYDAIALFHHFTLTWGTTKFAILSLVSSARARAGLDNGRGWFLTEKVRDEGFGAVHEVEYWLRVAARLGGDCGAGWKPSIPIEPADREVAAKLLGGSKRPTVAVHTGAGWYSLARIWPTERFAQVARALIAEEGASIVVLGGPDETEQAARLVEQIGYNGRVLNMAGRTSIHQTAAVIERCDLFLGNDSGPMHIAAAVGTPVVAVFGPSNQAAWGPYTPPGEESKHTIVARDLPCMPCFYRGHSLGLREGCGTRPCLTGLAAAPVLQACKRKLERRLHAT
jgi:heptosyltransferase-2